MRGTAGIEPAASTGQRSPHHRDSGEHHDADRRPIADGIAPIGLAAVDAGALDGERARLAGTL
jgi:hypothetical protein